MSERGPNNAEVIEFLIEGTSRPLFEGYTLKAPTSGRVLQREYMPGSLSNILYEVRIHYPPIPFAWEEGEDPVPIVNAYK